MAEAMLEFFTAANRLQFAIYAKMPVLAARGVHSSGTNPGSSNTPGWTATRLDIGGLTTQSFLAFVPNDGVMWAPHYVERNGSTSSFHFFVNGSSSITWFAFDALTPQPASGAVFELMDENGVPFWQLQAKPAIASDYLQQPIGEGSLGPSSTSIPAGRRYAAAFGGRSGYTRYDSIGAPDGQPDRYRYKYLMDAVQASGGQLTVSLQIVDQSAGYITNAGQAAQRKFSGPRNVMILDVTSY
ncbi:hypothetical protein CA234_03135 [Sphingomonas sp. ABOLE]|uniref:hypothetical protein n=1 Tax=Sphingomonas sp. ABOLE TaxID=1985878 RepID=UPI000F7F69CE|nr:hypothetical protein [Sphingomonas sp. ABOLE]RSV44423.1 hypothetical protein CA234_03135 [Sphingomonas sp. ABOLE]